MQHLHQDSKESQDVQGKKAPTSEMPNLKGAAGQGMAESLLPVNKGPLALADASIDRPLRGLDRASPRSSGCVTLEAAVRKELGVEKPCRQ